MKKVGLSLAAREYSFSLPPSSFASISLGKPDGVAAEFVKLGGHAA